MQASTLLQLFQCQGCAFSGVSSIRGSRNWSNWTTGGQYPCSQLSLESRLSRLSGLGFSCKWATYNNLLSNPHS